MTARPLPTRATRILLAALALTALPSHAPAAEPDADGVAFFEKRIRPLLVQHCYNCHGADAAKVKGGLRLDTRDGLRKGGASGPALVPGDPDKSLLIRAVRHTTDDLRMPPRGKLPIDAIAALEAWVKRGAPDPRTDAATRPTGVDGERSRDFWAFRPVRDRPPPAVRDAARPLTPVDRFVLTALEAKGLRPVAPADRRTLIRRATFDLTGLPPTPEEVDAFLADTRPEAFARVVDRLLASPAYGERWGRHWLDLVRYADTAGDNSDYPVPQLVKYRDWVIRAVGRDMPYDRFIREQLAGDLLGAETSADSTIATGYLANARRFGSYEDARYPWHLTIEDTIDNLGRTFLGLTINCSRCHDHKFDPISQEDYYALYGFFQSTRYPWPGIELDKAPRDFVPLAPAAQVEAVQAERRKKLAAFDAEIKRLEAEKATADKTLKGAEKAGGERVAEALKRVDVLTKAVKAVRKEREDHLKKPLPFEVAYAVAEGKTEGKKKVGNACVQIKGDPERLGPEVPRRFLTVLGGQKLPADATGSGRLELARWIADPKNPLTARVMVNRVWQYHFGRGLVPTPSDFGKQGRPPTHPELLDYLAARFVEGGWSVKALHRLLMLSRVYQLSGADDEANVRLDPAGDYLWRFRRHRLDAESIRDTLLAVSGRLDRSPGGPHPFPAPTAWDFTQHKPFKAVYDDHDRRSVYLMTQRIQRHPFLALFDGADTNASTAGRLTSTTPLQALFLMNDPFVHARARDLAARLLREGSDDAGRVERGFVLLCARPPDAAERSAALAYLGEARAKLRTAGIPADQQDARAWESLVRALFLNNELVYVN